MCRPLCAYDFTVISLEILFYLNAFNQVASKSLICEEKNNVLQVDLY